MTDVEPSESVFSRRSKVHERQLQAFRPDRGERRRAFDLDTPCGVELPADSKPTSLVRLAGLVRRDILSIRQDVGALVAMHGGLKENLMGHLEPSDVTDADYAQAITEQLQWLHSLDQVPWPPEELGVDSPK